MSRQLNQLSDIAKNAAPDSFAAMFAESIARQEMRAGEVITAEVLRVDQNHVVVNAGLKSESFIPLEEFFNDQGQVDVKEGDFVSVAIEALEDGRGETRLSRDRAKRLAAWVSLEQALESGENVIGTVTGKVKGGLTVMTNGIRAFLPGSLVDTRPIKDTSHIEGKTLDFRVIKLDRKRNNVVLSRRAIVEASMGEDRAKLMENLKEGSTVTGVVKNITDYGAFIDLGGIDGLLHITDMAWRRVRHPSEVLTVGQEITARVLRYDADKNRVSLGVKQLGDDPWDGIGRRYPQGTRMFGKVTNITDYGAFVEIEPGIEGLVHVSEMDWTNKNVNPSKVVQVGDEVEVMVLEIDGERRRISLGMKQCRANPWQEFAGSHNKGDKVKGQIKSITDFGVFIGLPGNIDGLVHLSDLSWSETGEEAVRNFKKGDELEAVVLAIDVERERISLGVKQLDGDPFNSYISRFDKGAVVKGTVKSVDAKGAVITLDSDVEGYLRASEISRERVEDATKVMAEGDSVEAMIVNVDRKARSINLSIKAKDSAEAADAMQKMAAENTASSGTTSLGALLRAKLDDQQSKE
ncbi:MAG: 30S ribosomal protein S1 [Betaproteobacteria bacterium]|jgi:small subunit ribosomal protein S1|nr:30S ribosomal protein S1 [Betaproteobacteria bacterium]